MGNTNTTTNKNKFMVLGVNVIKNGKIDYNIMNKIIQNIDMKNYMEYYKQVDDMCKIEEITSRKLFLASLKTKILVKSSEYDSEYK